MTNIQFENSPKTEPLHNESENPTGMIAWFIKKNLAKDENSAKKLMTIITVMCFAVALYFIFK